MLAVFKRLLYSLRPHSLPIARQEMVRATLGVTLALLCTSFISLTLSHHAESHHWLVASFGASALLLFLVPSSPLAQPWNILLGNSVSAFIGISCARYIPYPVFALTLAASLSMIFLLSSRSVHPPSIAMAVFPVLNEILDYEFILFPVLTDSLILLALALTYNNLTGVTYPARHPKPSPAPEPNQRSRFTDADYDAALEYYKQSLNISREDLQKLLTYVHTVAFQRNLGTRHCAAIMDTNAPHTTADSTLEQAWALLQKHETKALAVLDADKQVVGILTQADFLRRINLKEQSRLQHRLREFVQNRRQQGRVADIMSSPVLCAYDEQSITELIPLFSQDQHRHLPVVDDEGRWQGMITQSDLMLELYAILRPAPQEDEEPA